ncbi:MAG: DUF2156 domain-containing protein [Spirochaetes bacterium]|nr:DUF2156 domain-containing protein [Spirochaetota bacterium]
MVIENLDLKHRELLQDKLYNIKVRLSEFSFANLYLFRKSHDYRVIQDDGCLFITGMTNDKMQFVLPLCEQYEPDMDKMRIMLSEYKMLFPVGDCWLKYFDENEFEVYHNKDDSDYIYTVEQMATYSGRDLSKKRNLLKQFLESYTYERKPFDQDNISEAREILQNWQNELNLSPEETDFHSASEAFDYMEELRLNGYIYIVDGKPAGYVLGEEISEDTYALHFAKGLKSYKGIYQFMYNDLAKNLDEKIKYINFEQDLGLQSLRQAKSSYKPDHMGEKYRVRFAE